MSYLVEDKGAWGFGSALYFGLQADLELVVVLCCQTLDAPR